MDLGISGLSSGFDWKSFVDQMVSVERAPEQRLRSDQSTLGQQNSAYGTLKTQLTSLKAKVDALKDASLYDSRNVITSDATLATATVDTNAVKGTFNFSVTQLASTATYLGGGDMSQPLTTNPSNLALGDAAFSGTFTAGTFSVNGQKITVAATDKLQDVLDRMTAALGVGGAATYDSASDRFQLTSNNNIILGSGADTSNFLDLAKLDNNAADPKRITSAFSVAAVQLDKTLQSANLFSQVTGTTNQSFEVNGVSITYNPASDTLNGVLDRINSSSAGVVAAYDTQNDRLVLTNKSTGNLDVYVGNDTGSFLAAVRLQRGGQSASTAPYRGGPDISQPLTTNPSNLALGDAAFSGTFTAGTFSINGQAITVAATDKLQDVLGRMTAALGPGGAATYDTTSDKFQLTSTSNILLGNVADTSNFLSLAKLDNSGGNPKQINSTSSVAAVRLDRTLQSANLFSPITGTTSQSFEVNGVSITYNPATDTLNNVLDQISNSSAGVVASYDTQNDRLVLTNKSAGSMDIRVGNDTGNFLAATRLQGKNLQPGADLLYSVNGGPKLASHTNTITAASSGITGLSVNVLEGGTEAAPATFSVTVASDTSKVKSAIEGFVSEYNKTQSLIDSQTASSTAADGTVSAGVMANQRDVTDIATQLRSLSFSDITGTSGAFSSLAKLGISTGGYDNNLTLDTGTTLNDAISGNLLDIKNLFTSTNGVADRLSTYLDQTAGESGTLVTRQANLTTQSATIDTQVADMERIVLANKQSLTDSFVAMETAQQKIKQQASYLANLGTNGA